METVVLDDVNLGELSRVARDMLAGPVEGAVVGRTAFRDAVLQHLRCSQLEAEQLVDSMVARGLLVKTEDQDGRIWWHVRESSA